MRSEIGGRPLNFARNYFLALMTILSLLKVLKLEKYIL